MCEERNVLRGKGWGESVTGARLEGEKSVVDEVGGEAGRQAGRQAGSGVRDSL